MMPIEREHSEQINDEITLRYYERNLILAKSKLTGRAREREGGIHN